ncbi:MAG: hypothetical protein V5A74_08265 [Desulfohalobiaceae bacterium]
MLVFACLLLIWGGGGCAPLQREEPSIDHKEANSTWSEFWARQDRGSPLTGASLQGSLNIFTPEQKRRVTFELWGNLPTPLRLHLRAGIGATISIWEIRDNRVLIFSPRTNEAYIAANTAQATAAMGMRLPFSMPEMAQLLTGKWQDLLTRMHDGFTATPNGYAFSLQGEQRIERVVLDDRARVVAISGNRPYGWSMERKALTARGGRILSRRIELTTQREEELILRVKEFEQRSSPWPEADMRLTLPQDTEIRTLRPVDLDGNR